MFAMRRMAKPVIASVEGAAAGAGVSLALAADLVIADSDAFFTLAYCHIGTSQMALELFTFPGQSVKAMEIVLLRSLHCRTS